MHVAMWYDIMIVSHNYNLCALVYQYVHVLSRKSCQTWEYHPTAPIALHYNNLYAFPGLY